MHPLPTLRPAALLLTAGLAAGLLAAPAGAQDPVEVLFLGNSYTQQNGLPSLVAGLATAAGIPTVVASNTPGGCTWGSPQGGVEHERNPTTQALIAQGSWDVVVLQEQSTTPAIDHTRTNFMLPAAVTLAGQVAAANPTAELVLYQTWGRKDPGTWCWGSWCQTYAGFDAMQDALTAAYDQAAALTAPLLPTRVAPCGEAWRLFFQAQPGVGLHAADGSHPSPAGSYLAACAIFATVFDRSPVGSSFHGTLTASEAATLQQLAAEAVFGPTCGYLAYGPPSGGVQSLVLQPQAGPTGPGDTLVLAAAGLPAGAPSYLLALSLAPADLPLFGGTLLVDLGALALPLQLVTAGSPWSLSLPADPAFTGLDVHLQAAAPDPAQPAGWALSGGLLLQPCP